MRILMVGVLATAILAGCSSSTEPGAEIQSAFGAPVVPGLFVRNENADVIGIWGRPVEGGIVSFPNPSNYCSISFENGVAGPVQAWVEAAIGPGGDPSPERRTALGGSVLIPGNRTVNILIDDQLTAGVHHVIWNARDGSGERVPTGFYRIYVQTPEGLMFDDHFIAHEADFWVPAGLERFIQDYY